MSEDLGTITLRADDAALLAATTAIFEKLDTEHRTRKRRIPWEELIADFRAIDEGAAELLEKPLPLDDETEAWLRQEVKKRHGRHFDYGWVACDASIDPVWNICSDRVDSLTPEDFSKQEDRVSISWMHGEQSHVFVPFMIHVFKQMGFSDIRTRFDYEDGDPFGE